MKQVLIHLFTLFIFTELPAFTLIAPDIKGFDTNKLQIHYSPVDCYSGAGSDIKKAIDFWNSAVHANLEMKLAGQVSVSDVDLNTLNFSKSVIIGCTADMNALPSGIDNKPGGVNRNFTLAFARSKDEVGSDKKLDKGYVILNADPNGNLNLTNLDSGERIAIIAHKLGHVLGLGHSSVKGALMYFTDSGYEARLGQDDIDGIRHLYPQNELDGEYFLGCALVKSLKQPPSGFNLLLILPLLMFLFLKIKRKWLVNA